MTTLVEIKHTGKHKKFQISPIIKIHETLHMTCFQIQLILTEAVDMQTLNIS